MACRPHDERHERGTGSRGFTLIEMLVVIAILGALTTSFVTLVKPYRDRTVLTRLGAALDGLIVRARSTAMREGHSTIILFDPAARSVRIEGNAARITLDPDVTLSLVTAREAANGGQQGIIFLPDGTGSGGRFELRIAGNNAPGRGARISWLTGAVTREP